MPGMDRPLTRTEIAQVLHGIHDVPSNISVSPSVASAALSATVNGLALWCNLEDVEGARAQLGTSGLERVRRFLA